MDLVIRRARRTDKRDVLAAVRTIWGGQDRIPEVFDTWVTHRSGPFFVAESAGRVVGMGKLTVVSRTEAWLEGGRVAPRWRRRGIATTAIARGRAFVSGKGVGAAALLGDRYEGSLMIAAIGGRARPLADLLLGLRAEAKRRGLDDASFYVSNVTERRAARSAGYRKPWSGETYLFEKRLRERVG